MTAEHILRALVADPHPVTRVGIRSLLERRGSCRVVAEASCLSEARARLEVLRDSLDLIVTDVLLSDGPSLDLIREARIRPPAPEVIVLASFANARLLRRTLAMGIRAFALKEGGGRSLLKAIDCSRLGGLYLDPRLGKAIVDALALPESVERQAADERLLAFLAHGLTDRDMARVLGENAATVSRAITQLLKRMGVSSRAAAVTTALHRGVMV